MTAPTSLDNFDPLRLNALALAATPGPWHWVNPTTDEPRKPGEWRASLRSVAQNRTVHGFMLPEFILEADEIRDKNLDANADFIAAANPAAVLHLLALHDDRCREVLDLAIRLAAVEAELARVLAERDRLQSDASWDRNPDRSGA